MFTELATRRAKVEVRLARLEVAPADISPQTAAEQYEAVLNAVRETRLGEELTPAEKHAVLSALAEQIVPEGEARLTIRLKRVAQSVNNIEIIQWLCAWDDTSEQELGVPENNGAQMIPRRAIAARTAGALTG